ncbi:MAG: nitroreductase family protein [Burkholderiales bacterium]|nr:nitroreductase family protein [Burkholderiales bacterium]
MQASDRARDASGRDLRPPCAPALPDPPSAFGEDGLACMLRRHSVGPKYLVPPAPSPRQWRQAAAVALRAPDHGDLRPFRFVVVGDDQRERLAGLFAQDAARRGHLAEEVERARARAGNGPGLVALVARIRDGLEQTPVHEQWISVGAGLMNFLNALHLMDFGAKTLSGASVRDADVVSAFCAEGETLVAWIVVGTPTHTSRAKRADDVDAAIGPWPPAARSPLA